MSTGEPQIIGLKPITITAPKLLKTDGVSITSATQTPVWGVYKNGVKVLSPDSVKQLAYRNENPVVSHPIEEGKFETYNKVATPFEIHLVMVKGGTNAERASFIKTSDSIVSDIELYDVVTPEVTYLGVTFTSYDYDRAAEAGLGLLKINFALKQVRAYAKARFLPAAKDSGETIKDGGSVQPAKAPVSTAEKYFSRQPKPVFNNSLVRY